MRSAERKVLSHVLSVLSMTLVGLSVRAASADEAGTSKGVKWTITTATVIQRTSGPSYYFAFRKEGEKKGWIQGALLMRQPDVLQFMRGLGLRPGSFSKIRGKSFVTRERSIYDAVEMIRMNGLSGGNYVPPQPDEILGWAAQALARFDCPKLENIDHRTRTNVLHAAMGGANGAPARKKLIEMINASSVGRSVNAVDRDGTLVVYDQKRRMLVYLEGIHGDWRLGCSPVIEWSSGDYNQTSGGSDVSGAF